MKGKKKSKNVSSFAEAINTLFVTHLYNQIETSKKMEIPIPVIDFDELEGENRKKTMAVLHQACEKWGFFQVRLKRMMVLSSFHLNHLIATSFKLI